MSARGGRRQTDIGYTARMEDEQESAPSERELLERDSEISYFIASGPGGQHRNRNATGVRLVHRPSGIVVTATERRSQWANREVAFERLARRLAAAAEVQAPRVPTRPTRSSRVERQAHKRRRGAVKQLRGRVKDE